MQMVRLLLVMVLGSRSASEPYTVSGGCLFLVQAVRLLLLVGLIMSLTQVSGMLA